MASMQETINCVINICLVATLLSFISASGFVARTAINLLKSSSSSNNLTLINSNFADYNSEKLQSDEMFKIIDVIDLKSNSSNTNGTNDDQLTMVEIRERAADEELLDKAATNATIVGILLLVIVFFIFCSLICCFRTLLFGPAELIV